MEYGTAEHATQVTEGRHPGIRDGLQWLTFAHLPEQLRKFSLPFYSAACDMLDTIKTDSPELTTAINKLIEAKDSAMRAGIRDDTGRAGSVPRPQEVVDPPSLTGAATTDWAETAIRDVESAAQAARDMQKFAEPPKFGLNCTTSWSTSPLRPIRDNPQA